MSSRNLLFVGLGIFFSINPSWASEINEFPLNSLIEETIRQMPVGGGYSTSDAANHALSRAFASSEGVLHVDASHAVPSYCSGATYLVFAKVLSELQARQQLLLSPEVIKALRPESQPDGTGIWGRWNANGPGTARLFYELGLGTNFTDPAHALPGDFLKIFWNDAIGASEHGHSVIFLGMDVHDGVPCITYWSSNIPKESPGGFGVKTVPLSRIHRMLFSRLEHPENLNGAATLPCSDRYLASLQGRSSTPSEMAILCGLAR